MKLRFSSNSYPCVGDTGVNKDNTKEKEKTMRIQVGHWHLTIFGLANPRSRQRYCQVHRIWQQPRHCHIAGPFKSWLRLFAGAQNGALGTINGDGVAIDHLRFICQIEPTPPASDNIPF